MHLAFSNMMAQFKGAPDGGLIEPVPSWCLTTWCYLDHDQRNTLSTGFDVQLPRHYWFSNNVVYGSGVLKADGPDHLPQHTTADVSLGKSLGERTMLTFTVLNLTNSRYPFSVNSSFAERISTTRERLSGRCAIVSSAAKIVLGVYRADLCGARDKQTPGAARFISQNPAAYGLRLAEFAARARWPDGYWFN